MLPIIKIKETSSTNDYLLRIASERPEWEGAVVCEHQTAGKGMGKNCWESEDGKNLLYSIMIHPAWMPAHSQYLLSMAQAIAISDTLAQYTEGITIKWPNDIYWHDRKISGTRIDTNLNGSGICDMVIGTGVNVNQMKFVSDAPNPVSLIQITGVEHNVEELLYSMVENFGKYCKMLEQGDYDTITRIYHERLYRRDGIHRYRDADGEFEAYINKVHQSGVLQLKRTDGTLSEYMFKEVEFVI